MGGREGGFLSVAPRTWISPTTAIPILVEAQRFPQHTLSMVDHSLWLQTSHINIKEKGAVWGYNFDHGTELLTAGSPEGLTHTKSHIQWLAKVYRSLCLGINTILALLARTKYWCGIGWIQIRSPLYMWQFPAIRYALANQGNVNCTLLLVQMS